MDGWVIAFIVIAIIALCAGAAISVSRAASKSRSQPQYHPRVETSEVSDYPQTSSPISSAPYPPQENALPYPSGTQNLPYPSDTQNLPYPSDTQNLPYPTSTQTMPLPINPNLPYPSDSNSLPYPNNMPQPPPLPMDFYNPQQTLISANTPVMPVYPSSSPATSGQIHDPPPPYNPFMNQSQESNSNEKF